MSSWPNGTDGYVPDGAGASARAATVTVPLSADMSGAWSEQSAQSGAVRIARRVLRTVVEQAALSVPGVARMASVAGRPGLRGWMEPRHGVRLDVRGDMVSIDLYLIAAPGARMVETGTAVQEAVGAAVEHILGMGVSAINVYIQDVA
jgi:uncharacterized alkaline shock family protein YloU